MAEPDKRPEIDRRIALDARDWIVRLASGNIGDAELQRFRAWRDLSPEHGRAFERERVFWQQLQILDGRSDGTPPFRTQRSPRLSRRGFVIGGGMAAAAGIAATVALPRLNVMSGADHLTAVGEQREIPLPDGSVVTLNTDSAIAVDFTPGLRLVKMLRGEAEFQVRPDVSSLFRVAALGGNSDALGTIFSVKAVDNMATITVREGRVRVAGAVTPTESGEGGEGNVELAASEQTRYAAGTRPSPASAVDAEIIFAWRSGRVIFEGLAFSAAVAELGRYVPERVVLGSGANRDVPISAMFSTSDALAALEALAKTQGLAARRIPGLIILIA